MLIFLYGKDTYRSREHLKKMIERFRSERDPGGYNITRIDAATEREPKKIIESMLAIPFLASRRFIAIESLLTSKHADVQEAILDRIEHGALPESNVIVFCEQTDSWKTKIAKALSERLSKEKYSQKFDVLSGPQLTTWISAEVVSRGGNITPVAVQYIAREGVDDMWAVSTLIDQLIAFVYGKSISVADVQLFLQEKVDDNIFTLVDAIVSGDDRRAYSMIQAQYRKGEDVQFMFAMLLRQFRILLHLQDASLRESTVSSDVLAKRLSLHPFVVKKSLPMLRRYGMGRLRAVYKALLDFDIGIKTGQGSPEVLLDIFVARVGLGG